MVEESLFSEWFCYLVPTLNPLYLLSIHVSRGKGWKSLTLYYCILLISRLAYLDECNVIFFYSIVLSHYSSVVSH